uniref:RNA polymerase II-associated factor 1 homolog n=1 Tax=Panagrellus redivivus TaxID=6233 RepID=A0A7E4ZS72_PANRE
MSQKRHELLKSNQTQRPEHRLDIYTKTRHKNTLPDIPMEPKFLTLPFIKLSRFAEYKTTNLEKNNWFELTTERDLDINIDLVDAKSYVADVIDGQVISGELDPVDKFLIEDDVKLPTDKRRANHSEVVSWMRKTQYLGVDSVRFGVGADRQETKVGYKLYKSGETDDLYKDRQAQIDAINRTFEDVKKPVRNHPTKRGVTAVEEFPILPDFEFWKLPFAQVLLDCDPIPFRKNNKEKLMEKAVIQGVTDSTGAPFVSYYAATDDTLKYLNEIDEEARPPTPGHNMEYRLGREYQWTVRSSAHKGFETNYFFVYRDGKAYYNSMDTRVKLSRRAKGVVPEVMFVNNVPLTADEIKDFETRASQLNEREIVTDVAELAEVEEEKEEPALAAELHKKKADIFGQKSDDSSSDSSSGSESGSSSSGSSESSDED